MAINMIEKSSLPKDYSVLSIIKWLADTESYLHSNIANTSCRKWSKWYSNGESPYPCVCPKRDSYCLFLEVYYSLSQSIEIYNTQTSYLGAIREYESIQNDTNGVLQWVEKYKKLGNSLFFEPIHNILTNSEKNDKLTIKLNPDEFSTVIQFQEIFNTVYYSEEFQTNINQ